MSLNKTIISFSLLILFSSCAQLYVPHRAFVGQPNEPLLIKNKKESQFSSGISPFKYIYCDYGYSPIDHIVTKAHFGGTFGLINANVSILNYGKFKSLNYFTGLVYNFQNNVIDHTVGNWAGTYLKSYSYACLFNSVGGVSGVDFGDETRRFHFGLKYQYNIVSRYNYYFEAEDRYTPVEVEYLDYKIPNFFNFEPSFSIVWAKRDSEKKYYRFYIGLNIVQTTLKNHYRATGDTWYGYKYTLEKTYSHPRAVPFSLGFAFMFHKSKD